jgi:hypothetical protein
MTITFVPSAAKTTSPGHGHLMPQPFAFSQRTNVHQYDPDRDVVGTFNSVKPQHYTTIYVTTNFKTSDDMLPGQWIVLSVIISARDHNGLPPRKFYARDIAIGNDHPGRDAAWQQLTITFKGFPTQSQLLQVYIVRRAWNAATGLGGDFGSVPATQDLYVCSNVISYGGFSTAPSTPQGGYGFQYGHEYGEEL